MDLEHDAALAEIRSAAEAPEGDDSKVEVVDRGDQTRNAPVLGGKFRNPWDTSTVRFGTPPRAGCATAPRTPSSACRTPATRFARCRPA